MEIDKKFVRRIGRVMRLMALAKTYYHYRIVYMNHQLLQVNNSWDRAEKLSNMWNTITPHSDYSPTDFIHNKDELTNELINHYEESKYWIDFALQVGLSLKTLTLFCGNVHNLQPTYKFKETGYIFYSKFIMAIYLYLNQRISKKELHDAYFDKSYLKAHKPASIAEFRKTLLDIEKEIEEIENLEIEDK